MVGCSASGGKVSASVGELLPLMPLLLSQPARTAQVNKPTREMECKMPMSAFPLIILWPEKDPQALQSNGGMWQQA